MDQTSRLRPVCLMPRLTLGEPTCKGVRYTSALDVSITPSY